MPTKKFDRSILEAAILGFESQKKALDIQIAELRQMLNGGPAVETAATPEAPTGKRRKFSAASRRRMKEAQQRRWAKIRGESEAPAPAAAEVKKPKRKLSEAGRANIVKALKKRWAAKKAVAKKAGVKKAAVKKNVSATSAQATAPAA